MPSAPLGGRLREADTWPCLVVSVRSSSHGGRKRPEISAILARRRGRHTNVPRPAPSGQAGLGRAAKYRRAIAPDRGHFRPWAAPRKLRRHWGHIM